jgi:hypothetical protein
MVKKQMKGWRHFAAQIGEWAKRQLLPLEALETLETIDFKDNNGKLEIFKYSWLQNSSEKAKKNCFSKITLYL